MDHQFPSPLWRASWIGFDAHPKNELGFFAFRARLELAEVPASFLIRVSADQRYKLFVNGNMVAFGPQRGDERHWFYEEIDLGPWLRQGQNWLAALVWNFDRYSPMAQHSARLGFVLEGLNRDFGVDTPGEWQVAKLPGWDFDMIHSSPGHFYIDVGPGEILDGRMHSPGWEIGAEKQDLDWRKPTRVSDAEDRGNISGGTPWSLVKRSIPPMLYAAREVQPMYRRGFVGDTDVSGPADGSVFDRECTLKPGQPILLDYGELLCAYPRIRVKGQPGECVKLTYAEALWNLPEPGRWWGEGGKSNRNEVAGKQMQGYQDHVFCAGQSLTFEPAWWRTYRYLMLECAGDSEVTLENLEAIETGYPYVEESKYTANDPRVEPIWDVSIRTAKRCAAETYFDCPYYEQLQYVGDTRIQALIHYYIGRDRLLQRNAVETLGWSLMDNGLTQSRYPSRQTQVIPPFSLWWVMMLYDQMLYDRMPDPRWVSAIPRLLEAFERLDEDPQHPFWLFSDWVPQWKWGMAPGGIHHPMQALLLQMAKVAARRIQDAAEGQPLDSRLSQWEGIEDPGADSEHSATFYRVMRQMAGLDSPPWPAEELAANQAHKATYFFAYYKHMAMQPGDYMETIADWTAMVERGLTTFAENPEPTRSDCHAWSSHPILGFLQYVAGIGSIGVGWSKVKIEPKPGVIESFRAEVAHPAGHLAVSLGDSGLKVTTPVPAKIVWNGETREVNPGEHSM